MNRKISAILALTVLILVCAAFVRDGLAAGTATWTVDNQHRFTVYRCAWTSDASGNVSAGTGVDGITVTGKLKSVNFKSVAGSVPTDLYDVQLLTAGGENVLYDGDSAVNRGANIPSALDSNDQRRTPFTSTMGYKVLYNEILTPSITNAGNAKSGIIEMIIE